MRILSMLASPAAGGAEILVRNLSAEFVRQGHEARVLFMSDAAAIGNPAHFERGYLAELTGSGSSYDIMEPGCFGNPIKATRRLLRSVADFRPDLLHIHLARALLARSLVRLEVPTVYTHHNVTTNFAPWLFRFFDRSVDHYVAIGDACQKMLERHVQGPIAAIPNGVPTNFSHSGPRTKIGRDPFILAVGNLNPKKDYAILVEAAAAVVRRLDGEGRRARFAIAGEGPERERIEKLIEARGLADRFELLGARSDVAELMAEADLLVNSSAHEGLPITLIEAAMSGLPAVVTDVGGNAEVVIHGSNGLVVPPAQPILLADSIIHSLSDTAMHRRFSEAGIHHGRRFTIASCAKAHLKLYADVLPPAT